MPVTGNISTDKNIVWSDLGVNVINPLSVANMPFKESNTLEVNVTVKGGVSHSGEIVDCRGDLFLDSVFV